MVTRSMRRAALLLTLLAFAGCTVGPDYHLPNAAVINTAGAKAAFVVSSPGTQASAPPDKWWHLYSDPVLDGLIQRAFAANTNLRIAQANLERTDALLAQAKTGREIDASVDLDTSYVQQSAEAYLQHEQPPRKEIYNTGITASYDLDLFGRIRRGIEAANDDSEAAIAARDLVRVNVAAQTSLAYAQICDNGSEIAALQNAISLQNQALALTRLMRANGRAVRFDVDRVQGQSAAIQAEMPMLRASQLNAAYRLSTLIGQPPDMYDHTWLRCHQPLRLLTPIPTGNGQMLLARRPDVHMAERRLAADTARIGVATADLYPDIKLGVAIGSTGSAASLLSPLTNRFAIGPMISWDANQSAARARIVQARAQTKADLAAFDGTVLTALLETQTALNSYGAALDRLADLNAVRDQATQVARTAQELRIGGREDALSALMASEQRAAATRAVAHGESEVSKDQIAVFLALGGGWGAPAP